MTKNSDSTGAAERPLEWPEAERPLLPFVPMIYVAWADGVLSADEIRGIREQMRAQPWLTDRARAVLDRWLDPDAPPSPAMLHALYLTMREIGEKLPEAERLSLAGLGLAIARAGSPATAGAASIADRPEVGQALVEIEGALGVVGEEALREVFAPERPAAGAAGEAAPTPAAPAAPARPASFDPAALGRFLDGDRRPMRERVFRLLREPRFRPDPDLGMAARRQWVFDRLAELAEHGLGAVAYPEAYGGEGDVAGQITAFESLAFGDIALVVKYGVQFGLFGGSILSLGTRRHHERYLRDVASLRLPGCYAMTEAGHGSNVRDIETTATYDAGTREFVIHTPNDDARKIWIGNAALHGRMATVFAQLEVGGERHGVHAFLVPIRDEDGKPLPGIRIEDCGHKEGLNGIDNGQIWFDRVRIPRENLLDRFGQVSDDGVYSSPIPSDGRRFFTMLGTLVAGRISVAAASVSAAKTGLTIATRYANRRRQFGPAGHPEVPVLDYRTMQRRLLPRIATTFALDFAVRDLVRRFADRVDGDLREVEALAAGLKAYASWHTVDTLQACREACGGMGYASGNRFGDLKADTDVFTTFEGDNTVLLQLVAKSLLTGYREELGGLQLRGIVRHLTRRAATRIVELNPIATRRTDEAHLRDPDFHRAAFRYREERLLVTAARRLKRRIDQGTDSFEALEETQDHLVALALGSVERTVLERCLDAVESCDDAALRPILEKLAALFALSRIEDDRGWFLENGYIEGAKAKAIRNAVNALCAELRPDAVALVDAFGIPDEVLAAPIALAQA